ncbi:hypothetical protein DN745_10705 [Bradymonas sediminis]|uniref:Uncharacterized protein n=1 Tax=Bradymonas sediminis TaxID=1548548 RepID=A0A2Z4FLS2_9DELT|nr:hypothetical protein DN745_10705 [Bradymonas sediminis]
MSALVLLTSGCETSKPVDKSAPTSESPKTISLTEAKLSKLIARAERARDRKLQTPPTFRAVQSLADAPASQTKQPADRGLLAERLFGVADMGEGAPAPYASIARYERAENRVDYTPNKQQGEDLEVALLAAIVAAIDAQNFEPQASATTWDAALTQAVAREATVLLALGVDRLAKDYPDATIDLLASRPELATDLPHLGDWIAFHQAQNTGAAANVIGSREQSFVTREAWRLATALYRSSGWSGVELVGAMPPTRSADVVRPDQWMRGAPVGKWTWPEESRESLGTVGPAIIAIWLEDVVDARLTQSLYAGYLSDAYRYDAASKTFEWLTLWDSPSSASQVAAAFEQRLRERFKPGDGAAEASGRFSVFAEGLTVGVIIESGDDSDETRSARRARAEHLLKAHTVELMPRAPLPTKFVPTRRDEFVARAAESTLEERVWKASDVNLRLDLNPLGDDWRVQRPDAGTLRWFASHQDGALLQLTVELDNPLGPAFGSEHYQKKTAEALRNSFQDASVEVLAKKNQDTTGAFGDSGLMLRLRGRLNQQKRVLQLWQFRRGDMLISYSLQSPPESFDARLAEANAIVSASRRLRDEDEVTNEEPSAADGQIDYKIED